MSNENEIQKKLTFEEAEKLDSMSAKYFKPETNIQYELSFSEVDGEGFLLFRKDCQFKKDAPVEQKTCLRLHVENINGNKPENEQGYQVWDITSIKLRTAFETYCKNGNILKKIFSFKQKGEGVSRTFQVAEASDKILPES